jgi:hypothetical protein
VNISEIEKPEYIFLLIELGVVNVSIIYLFSKLISRNRLFLRTADNLAADKEFPCFYET